jgi:hypothetical protein
LACSAHHSLGAKHNSIDAQIIDNHTAKSAFYATSSASKSDLTHITLHATIPRRIYSAGY